MSEPAGTTEQSLDRGSGKLCRLYRPVARRAWKAGPTGLGGPIQYSAATHQAPVVREASVDILVKGCARQDSNLRPSD